MMKFLTNSIVYRSTFIIFTRFYRCNESCLDLNKYYRNASSFNMSFSTCVTYRPQNNQSLFKRPYSNTVRKVKRVLTFPIRYIEQMSQSFKLALILYQCTETIPFKDFYKYLEMEDTFNSWFVIIELHVWMILAVIMDNELGGLNFRKHLVKAMWYDVEERLGNLGEKNPLIKPQLRELSGRFPITLMIYDEGLLGDDKLLASGLWYKFFDKQSVDPRKLEILISYIRNQVGHLATLNLRQMNEEEKISNIWISFRDHAETILSIK